MTSNETDAEIVKEVRQTGPYTIYRKPIFCDPSAISEAYARRFLYGRLVTDYGAVRVERPKIKEVSNYELADRIEAAHGREIAAKDAEIEGLQHTLDLHDLYADEECEDADTARIVAEEETAEKDREIAELRQCLKEAITEYCTSRPHEFDDGFGNCGNFKNGSCACSECWRLDCINKWRKALEGGTNEGK